MVIDDDEIDGIKCQRNLKQGLSSSTQVDMAGGWKEAIAAIERRAHDIYFIDQNLSSGTGLVLVRYYRESMQNCVFILFTGQDYCDIHITATEAGGADLIFLIGGYGCPTKTFRAFRVVDERLKSTTTRHDASP